MVELRQNPDSSTPDRTETRSDHRLGSRHESPGDQFPPEFGLFDEPWQPKIIAEMNEYQFKLVKLQGDFIWHDHQDTDEAFIVLEGALRIDLRDGAVHLAAGEMFAVPKGVEHKPCAEGEVKLLLTRRGPRSATALRLPALPSPGCVGSPRSGLGH